MKEVEKEEEDRKKKYTKWALEEGTAKEGIGKKRKGDEEEKASDERKVKRSMKENVQMFIMALFSLYLLLPAETH